MSELAILGGPKAVQVDPEDALSWPMITQEDEDAVLEVLRRGGMSGIDVTTAFEEEMAAWHGLDYALGFSSGTGAIHAALFGCKVGVGDEIISPSMTYWASCLPVFSLGGTVVFADIDPDSLCIDPTDIERHISERTKAIVVVHYCGYPVDMDAVMEIEIRAYDFPWTQGIFRDCLRVGYCCWCYENDETIQAYGVMSAAAGESHILNLTVRPSLIGASWPVRKCQPLMADDLPYSFT